MATCSDEIALVADSTSVTRRSTICSLDSSSVDIVDMYATNPREACRVALSLAFEGDAFDDLPSEIDETFFCIKYADMIMSPMLNSIEYKAAFCSLICADRPHVVDSDLWETLRAFAPELEYSPHLVMYSLCLNQRIPSFVRRSILLSTVLVNRPIEREPICAKYEKRDTSDVREMSYVFKCLET